ncbi:carbohydrate ABC transporter membrane protein 1 (CUT1 family) [Kribbella amoyensis]|uniref:Carbohydrate ABC transporter membrane protein 1 (CUT1 family) n=1 Tax=Kribbella amoyensis TaxID=996641 RepID=A0A561B2N4_9ACTN|nr:sugar ABC transporter permease [Kribbella amoyensis]TWD73118.1 carbohydrate ABC transporter membrane protein 1 (CUT1 family) [Kribbella amoyensis]
MLTDEDRQVRAAPEQEEPAAPTKRPAFHLNRQGRAAHIFLIPWQLGFLLITAVPLFASLYLAFTDYDILNPPEWTGLENFRRMVQDDQFWASVKVTLVYVLVSVPLQLGFALLLALILDRGLKGLAFYRSAFYLPSLLGTSVAIAILWREIFGDDGLINKGLGLLGIQGESWLQNPNTALATLIVLNVWTFGSPMVIFLAGLRQIPDELYEAAKVDGAGVWRQFTHVTIPLLTPIIFFNLILQTIGAFQTFTQAHIVSGGTGGPANSTLFYTLYVYQQGFVAFDMGYASALAWVLMVAIAAITALHFLVSKYWVFYGDN